MIVSAQATSEPAPEPRPGPDRHAVGLRPLDEVGDDQEVAGKPHLRDDVEFVGEPLVVVLEREARRRAGVGEAAFKPVFGLALQLGGLEPRTFSISLRLVVARTKRGRIGLRGSGRKAQRTAISTVLSSASGRSAKSAAISAALLK